MHHLRCLASRWICTCARFSSTPFELTLVQRIPHIRASDVIGDPYATHLLYVPVLHIVPLTRLQVFFSFLGFDCVASAAEEAVDPAASLPTGMVGSLLVVAAVYAAMCATIVGMVPWQDIDVDAPFAAAYAAAGMPWAARVVALGALLGITTCLLVSLFGQIRLWMALGRARLVPSVCVRPLPRAQTTCMVHRHLATWNLQLPL